ncbi:MAG: hypothetical protein UR85_C0002G0063 [Candidatus Nomurabacteria bacterium GW2011_GWF2_35_66]|uniref:Transglycosylase SLT domain-containing protein n=1 Tax=Candidatus Nomurabacteria bacterium GW2011_GWE1_35_16 TaxID=1618761 RepID=A0A0G0EHB6_9BACT|nr:MAG: hypothetical protein UR55_C0004G0023 [Candidatus Nomurabacteria bacterium GW2011_GWF1_34_20]KKP63462.1 MAG: hypothetical protein UR57_C0004G0023 [Candidatus Nomurabacteria bacterium GW2011_GWE2_34_25]KKP66642.1 MAG: hypothetical protein UR64_C0004G0023 [Candidatus Nomurabacteria bacterium GW2011_GWE1_35_16]KKP83750.1 MAG: hypothetical protein UR85_C0002G0063 [Candidatus Nomurabacteria bacterium GW2011_GWF2_35_66]HAE36441.1 hypothetical protein [Candidatus Nomurabacteria bacterium]
MKKYISYILVSFIIFVNLLLPFSIAFKDNKEIPIQKSIVYAETTECTISSAVWDPSGEQKKGFFTDGNTVANIIVKSKNCTENPGVVFLSVYEDDGVVTNMTNDVWNDSGLYNRAIPVPADNFAISLLLGEEDCAHTITGETGTNCDLYFKIGPKNNLYKSNNKLFYDCDTVCDENGKFLSVTALGSDDKPVVVDGQIEGIVNNDYNLLAPIGKFVKAPNDIGDYFNLIFKLAIGLCGVLAVVMIVISGIQYMGDESIFGKTEAKSKILASILGLFIALGSYALLNTIDPDLLGGKGVAIDQVNVKIEPLYDRGANDPKTASGESVRCTPVLSGPCSVANLTPIFGAEKAVAMSKICNMESGGSSVASGTDVCKPGNTSFSFGLFQVNLATNGILAGKDCVDLFDKRVRGADAIEPKYTSGYSCKLLPGKENLYNTCKNRLLDTTTNLAIAKSLFHNSYGMNNWIGDKKYCASAFK